MKIPRRLVLPASALVLILGLRAHPVAPGLATDSPPALPPVMTIFYAGDSNYVFRDDATSADRGVFPDDGLSEGLFGPDEATFSATHFSANGEEDGAAAADGARVRAWQLLQGRGPMHTLRYGAVRTFTSGLTALEFAEGLPGEVRVTTCALALMTPAGPPLVWSHTYRSRAGTGGLIASGPPGLDCGTSNFASWDVRIEAIPPGSGTNAPELGLYGGDGRHDVLARQADGTYSADGMFRQGQFNPDGSFTLTFADRTTMNFCALDGSPTEGRICALADRNGVALTCSYGGSGELLAITSAFGQSLTCSYGPDGKLATVADQTGRFVQYSYYVAGDAGGSPGDLKSVSCAQIPGAAPLAGPVTCVYATGNLDDALNHNLISVADGAGRLLEEYDYSIQSDPTAIDYDTVSRIRYLGSGDFAVRSHELLASGYRVLENDPLGRVTECDFDPLHRCVAEREYTGFSIPGQPVTSTTNRPSGKLRPNDPQDYETTFGYDAQNLCVSETLPDGTQLLHTYEFDVNPAGPVRERGNERATTLHPPAGADRIVTIDYLPGFGTNETTGPGFGGGPEPVLSSNPIPGVGIVVKRNPGSSTARIGPGGGGDGIGGDTDPLCSSNPIPGVGIVVKRNPGSSTARTGIGPVTVGPGDFGEPEFSSNPIPGVGIVVKHNIAGDAEQPVFSSNPIPGVGIVVKRNLRPNSKRSGAPVPESGGWDGESGATANMRDRLNQLEATLAGTKKLIGGISHGTESYGDLSSGGVAPRDDSPAVGGELHPGSPIGGLSIKGGRNPGGNASPSGSNRPGSPIGGLSIKGGRNPGGGQATRLVTAQGQEYGWGYDGNGNCTSYRTPVAGGGCDFTYNALGQCTSTTVLDGAGSGFKAKDDYDPVSGWRIGHVDDPAALALSRTCQRDALGRIVRCVDARGYDGLTEYDALDRVKHTDSPLVGSGGTAARNGCDCFYDAGGLLARFDVEQRDAAGLLDAVNPACSSFIVRDDRCRVVRMATEQRPTDVPTSPPLLDPVPLGIGNFATNDFSFDLAGQCVAVSVPGPSRGQAADCVCAASYDERGLPYQCSQGPVGDPSSLVMQYDYDLDGACVQRTQLSSAGLPGLVSTITYDGFHRLASCTDPMGNVVRIDRDASDLVTCSVHGELKDVDGSAHNVLLARARGRNGFGGGGGGGCGRACSPFFDVVGGDDVWSAERFTPGAGGPSVKQAAAVHRSPAGLVTSVTNGADTVLSCGYDSAGRVISCTDGASTLVVTRDEAGNKTRSELKDKFQDGDIPTEQFTATRDFDPLGRCVDVTDGAGNVERWAFDSLGRCTQYTDARGFVIRARWDGTVLGGGGVARDYTLLLEADVDGDGVPDRLCDSLVLCGELSSFTNSNEDTTRFLRDALGRCVERDDPDGTSETQSADDYGRLAKHKRKDGAIVAGDYDRNGRLASFTVTGPPGTLPVPPTSFSYDGLGRCVVCDQVDSRLDFTYDSLGNQLSEMRSSPGSKPVGVTRTFDARGRRSVTYSSGASYAERRDALGQIVTITPLGPNGTPAGSPVTTVEYVGHRVWREVRADGVVTKNDYRSDGEPALLAGDASFDECVSTVARDARGAVVQATLVARDADQDVVRFDALFGSAPLDVGRQHLQTFDPLHRLLRSVISRRDAAGHPFVTESDVSYTLDLEGLRLTATGGANPGVYVQSALIPPGDRQAGQYTRWPGGPLRWDDEGNLTKMQSLAGPRRFHYDALSRLVAVNDAATGATLAMYAYDGLGRRTRSTIPATNPLLPASVTEFVHDGARCVEELDPGGGPGLTAVCSESSNLAICVVSRNGTLVYPHGGGPQDPLDRACDGAPRIVAFITPQGTASSKVSEREDCDDACAPIFLLASGKLRPGATGTLCGYDWIPANGKITPIERVEIEGLARFCPETGFTQRGDGTYSPQLGRDATTASVPVIGNCVGAAAIATASR